MKIIQVCPRYYPDIGGVETHVQEISERLVKHGFNVEVVCTDPYGNLLKKEVINKVSIIRFRSYAPGNAYYLAPQIFLYLKNNYADAIHAHSYHALPAMFAALAKGGRKLVFTPHYHRGGHTPARNFLHTIYRPFGGKIFDRADKVVCVSEYEQKLVMSDFGVPEMKIEKIPNGLNLEEFADLTPERNGDTLLYVGRLEKYKGVQHIISALPQLDGFELVIVGKGPYENDLRELADKLGVSEHISWQSDVTREELLRHYASADVFLMLSTHEAYGITVAEALASGTPCVVAENGALKEFADNKMCFGLRNPAIVQKLAEKIFEVREIKTGFSDVLKDKIKSWDEVADEHERLYKEI